MLKGASGKKRKARGQGRGPSRPPPSSEWKDELMERVCSLEAHLQEGQEQLEPEETDEVRKLMKVGWWSGEIKVLWWMVDIGCPVAANAHHKDPHTHA